MTQTKHTPVPWRIEAKMRLAGITFDKIIGCDEFDTCVGLLPIPEGDAEVEANAQFIVTACNSHYELLEALKHLRELYDAYKKHKDSVQLADEIDDFIFSTVRPLTAKAEAQQ